MTADIPRSPVTVTTGPDAAAVATAAATALVGAVCRAQRSRGTAEVVLTGGGLGIAVLAAVTEAPDQDQVDWPRVGLWWGDERFLAAGHPDRNETQARAALLDRLDLDPARVHPMPDTDGPWGTDVDAAAAAYSRQLAAAPHPVPPGVPAFDVVLLGVGPDGHVASLFPGHPPEPPGATVIGVVDSPKPPPVRISLTSAALCGQEVWLLAAGSAKASAVRAALTAVSPLAVPAASIRGRQRTRWFLDAAAATGLPAAGA